MALDTRDKRASAINVGLPWRILPNPDGLALDQGDRQQVAYIYRGIDAGQTVSGIPRLMAGMIFAPGLKIGRVFTPGPQVGQMGN
jgi:hypothetical protein